MSMQDEALYWRLAYDGSPSIIDERDENGSHSSILTAKPGANFLYIMKGPRTAISDTEFPLMVCGVQLGKDYRPIFYRRRYREAGPSSDGRAHLECVVFGRVHVSLFDALANAKPGEHRAHFGGKLWMVRDGQVQDCPAWAIDGTMITVQGVPL